ncbi:MAG: hypothetical protein LBU60_00820, partial [Clostridiales bacterium]|nr:hypothetical protein [Clostridiales bacterium]
MQKKISYYGSAQTYAHSAAKQIAKRGYVINQYETLEECFNSIDEDTFVVVPLEHDTEQTLLDGNLSDSLQKIASQDKITYITRFVEVLIDYRIFVVKKEHFDYRNIETVRLTSHALNSCRDNIYSTFPQAKIEIVKNTNSVLWNLDMTTCGVVPSHYVDKELAMGFQTVSDRDLTVRFGILQTEKNFDKAASKIYFAFKINDEVGELVNTLNELVGQNVNLQSINNSTTSDNLFLAEVNGNIRQDRKSV